jgi:hypothetical protein
VSLMGQADDGEPRRKRNAGVMTKRSDETTKQRGNERGKDEGLDEGRGCRCGGKAERTHTPGAFV